MPEQTSSAAQDLYKGKISLHYKPPLVVCVATIVFSVLLWALSAWIEKHLPVPTYLLETVALTAGFIIAFALWAYEVIDDVNNAYHDLSQNVISQLERQVKEATRAHAQHINGMANCRFIGESAKAMDALFDSAKGAVKVRNTFVCFKLSEDDRGLTQTQIPRARERILNFVQNGLENPAVEWTDIVSQDVVHPPVDWLSVWTRCQNLAGTGGKHYHLRRLKTSYPITNFTILDFESRPTEVIFGQGHHSASPGGNVFRTDDERIVKNFESLWLALHNDSDPIEKQEKRPVAPADIEGIWFRVSYEISENTVTDGERLDPKSKLHDVGLVRIENIDDRRVRVEGNLFYTDLSPKREFQSVTTDLSRYMGDWRLWFSTLAQVKGYRMVSGFYTFPAPDGSSKIDRLCGEYHSQSNPAQKLQLLGFRLSERNFPEMGLGPDPKYFPAHKNEILECAYNWWLTSPNGEKKARKPSREAASA